MCCRDRPMRLILWALSALLIAGCGGGGGSAPVAVPETEPILPLPQGDNVLPVAVNLGPDGRNVNRL